MAALFLQRRRSPEAESITNLWDDRTPSFAAPAMPVDAMSPSNVSMPLKNPKAVPSSKAFDMMFDAVENPPKFRQPSVKKSDFENPKRRQSKQSSADTASVVSSVASSRFSSKAKSHQAEKPVAVGDNLYVQYIPAAWRDEDLLDLFSKVGEVKSCRVMMDYEKQRSKGYGFVLMSTPAEAAKAVELYHGAEFQGKRLLVRVAEHSPSVAGESNQPVPAALEQERAATNEAAVSQLYVKGVPQNWQSQDLKQYFGVSRGFRAARFVEAEWFQSEQDHNEPAQTDSSRDVNSTPSYSDAQGQRPVASDSIPSNVFSGYRKPQLSSADVYSAFNSADDISSTQNDPYFHYGQEFADRQEADTQPIMPTTVSSVKTRPPTEIASSAAALGLQFFRHHPYGAATPPETHEFPQQQSSLLPGSRREDLEVIVHPRSKTSRNSVAVAHVRPEAQAPAKAQELLEGGPVGYSNLVMISNVPKDPFLCEEVCREILSGFGEIQYVESHRDGKATVAFHQFEAAALASHSMVSTPYRVIQYSKRVGRFSS